MGQTMMVAAEKAGNALRRTILLLVAAAVVAAMMSMSASPALADHTFDGGNDFGDQELESGSIELTPDISLEGNYSDQDVWLSQDANTGNFANQQGFDGDDDNCWAWDPHWGWYYWCG